MLLNDIWRTINVLVLLCVVIALLSDPSTMIAVIVIGLLVGFLCKFMAEKKNRNGQWAFLYGFLWGLPVIIYYAICEKREVIK